MTGTTPPPALRHLLLAALLLTTALPLRADALNARLRQLLPGDAPATVNERQYLYQRLTALFGRMRTDDRADRKSTKKRTRRISDRLRRELFRDYRAGATLSDAFRSGAYSDVTAATLTALALERFNVEYDVFVDHWRSYLVADPERRKITLRAPGLPKVRDAERRAYRRQYLDLLRNTSLPEVGPLSEAGADSLFYAYHYRPDRPLTFGQLAAYGLYRRAMGEFGDQEFASSRAYLAEALQREERPAFLVLDQAANVQLAALSDTTVSGDAERLFRQWAEAPANRYLPAALLNHFDDRQRILLAEGDEAAARRLLADFGNRAPAGHADWLAQLQELQNFRMLAHLQLSGRGREATELAKQLYRERPNDARRRHVLGELLLSEFRRTSGDAADLTRLLEQTVSDFPFLRGLDRYADLLLRRRALLVRDEYAADRPAAANSALERFRRDLAELPNGNDRRLWTMTAFLSASNYHFQREDYPAARRLLAEALEHDPTNDYLLHRRELLLRY